MQELAVPLENPLLQALLSLLHDLEKDAVSNVIVPHRHRFEREAKVDVKDGFYDGALYAYISVQERLLELREKGMRKKAGTKT